MMRVRLKHGVSELNCSGFVEVSMDPAWLTISAESFRPTSVPVAGSGKSLPAKKKRREIEPGFAIAGVRLEG